MQLGHYFKPDGECNKCHAHGPVTLSDAKINGDSICMYLCQRCFDLYGPLQESWACKPATASDINPWQENAIREMEDALDLL